MSVEALATVLHHSRAKGTAKLVLIGIANHAGDGGAWPTHATLARYANVSTRNVRQAIARLVDLAEVRVEVQNGGTFDHPEHRRPNRYTVLVTCPGWCDRTPQHRDTRRRHGPPEALSTGGSLPTTVGGSLSTTHATDGGSLSTTVGGSLSTTKPSLEPESQQVVPQVQDRREAPCLHCGMDAYRCQRVQIHWLPEDRHPYTHPHQGGQAQQRAGQGAGT